METLINDFVSEHLAAFVVCVIIALAVFAVALWFVFSYVQFKKAARCEEHTRRIEEMGKATCNLPCNAHGDKIERHSVSVGKIETTLAFLAKSMDEISSQLRQMNGTSQLTRQNSPLTITERGWEAVRRLGIDRMFDGNWPRIRRLIDSEVESKNAYDINDFCIKHAVVYPEKFLRPEEIGVLKDEAYLQGLPLMDYMKIIAVMARDKYFEENGIKAEPSSVTK